MRQDVACRVSEFCLLCKLLLSFGLREERAHAIGGCRLRCVLPLLFLQFLTHSLDVLREKLHGDVGDVLVLNAENFHRRLAFAKFRGHLVKTLQTSRCVVELTDVAESGHGVKKPEGASCDSVTAVLEPTGIIIRTARNFEDCLF